MWFLYALSSALFASVRRASEKQLSYKLNHFTLGWTVQMAALPVLLVCLLMFGPIFNPLALGMNFWLPTMLICVGFYPLNQFLYIHAFRHGELSKILPLSSLGPVISLLLGWLLLSQVPSVAATAGILIIVGGVYVLNMKGRALHNPLKIFTADRANLYTLFSLLMNALAGVLDMRAINASGPMYYSFVSTLGAVVAMYVAARVIGVNEMAQAKQQTKPLLTAGVLFGLSYAAYIAALVSGPLAYVTAIRSSSALLIGSLVGFWFFKELFTKPKLVALILIVVGSTIVALG